MLNNLINKFFPTVKNEKACYAPAQSLRFNHSGKVLACCFNRGNILGTFPKQTISDIWFGNPKKRLGAAIAKNDYSLGCHTCEKEANCGNRAISGAAQYDYLKTQQQVKNFPTMFDFELGSTCNFECVMCSGEYSTAIRANREKQKPYYSPYEAHTEEFIEQLLPFIPHLKEMRFLGGEPFLMKVYYQIWDKVIELNPSINLNVLTNASILNKRVKSLLERGNFQLSVSLDSLKKETFEQIRKNGNFEQVMENTKFFQNLMKERGHTMSFNVCVMRQNWREMPDYFDYCNNHNIIVVTHTVKFPSHCSLWNCPADELANIVSYFKKNSIKTGGDIQSKNYETFNAVIKQLENWHQLALQKENHHEGIAELEKVFNEKIEAHEDYLSINSEINYKERILTLVKQFSENEQVKLLKYLIEIDTKLVIDEVNISSDSRLMERLKTIVLNN